MNKPATEVICFHCQQAVEKMLKAWLHWHEVPTARTHNLAELVESCKRIDPAFAELDSVSVLTPYAVELRYAEDFFQPSMGEALRAIGLAEATNGFVRSRLRADGVDPDGTDQEAGQA